MTECWICMRFVLKMLRILCRKIVRSLLEKDPHVLHFQTALYEGGSWGATEVELRRE